MPLPELPDNLPDEDRVIDIIDGVIAHIEPLVREIDRQQSRSPGPGLDNLPVSLRTWFKRLCEFFVKAYINYRS